jgi:ABC-type nickel/cobalt efflux system permease component RcnA
VYVLIIFFSNFWNTVPTGKSRYSDKLQNKKKQQQQQQQQQHHHHAIPEESGIIGRSPRKPQKACSGGEGSAPPKKSQVRT